MAGDRTAKDEDVGFGEIGDAADRLANLYVSGRHGAPGSYSSDVPFDSLRDYLIIPMEGDWPTVSQGGVQRVYAFPEEMTAIAQGDLPLFETLRWQQLEEPRLPSPWETHPLGAWRELQQSTLR